MISLNKSLPNNPYSSINTSNNVLHNIETEGGTLVSKMTEVRNSSTQKKEQIGPSYLSVLAGGIGAVFGAGLIYIGARELLATKSLSTTNTAISGSPPLPFVQALKQDDENSENRHRVALASHSGLLDFTLPESVTNPVDAEKMTYSTQANTPLTKTTSSDSTTDASEPVLSFAEVTFDWSSAENDQAPFSKTPDNERRIKTGEGHQIHVFDKNINGVNADKARSDVVLDEKVR